MTIAVKNYLVTQFAAYARQLRVASIQTEPGLVQDETLVVLSDITPVQAFELGKYHAALLLHYETVDGGGIDLKTELEKAGIFLKAWTKNFPADK